MPKINNKNIFPIDAKISDTDIVIGSDGDKSFKTRNYLMKDIKTYILGYEVDTDNSDGVGILTKLYTWVKFADDVDGTNMSDSPQEKLYIGLAFNKATIEESDDALDYFWSEIGGVASYIGADGKTYYIWTKYSNSADGSNMADEPTGMSYIGLAYNKDTPIESDDKQDYEWSLYLNDGILQQPVWLYYWIKFADNEDGTEGFSDNPDEKLFMGIAYDKLTPIESDDPVDYVWNPIQGEQGYIGPDGKTYWTWVKYALSNTATELFDISDGMTWIGIAVNKETSIESEDYTDYTWSKLPYNITIDQDNKFNVIEIPLSELSDLTEQAISDWVNANGIVVDETENIIFEFIEDETGIVEIPVLDTTSLVLEITDKTDSEVSLSWENDDDAIVKYDLIYYKPNESFSKSFTTEKTDTITHLENNVVYNAYVIAYDTEGNTKQSNTVQFLLFVTDTPNIWLGTNSGDVTTTSINVNYSIDTDFNADRYELYRDGLIVYDGENTYFNSTDLTDNTEYNFYVIAYNGENASLQSSILTVSTLQIVNPPLTQPTLTFISKTTTSISFSVNVPSEEVSRITQYQVQYRILGISTWTDISVLPNGIVTLSDLLSEEDYEIRVRTSDGIVVSTYSDILGVTTFSVVKAKISLLYESYNLLTETAIADGYVGQLSIYDGTPNTTVTVSIKVVAKYNNSQYVGDIYLKNSNITINSSLYFQTYTFTLDSSGKFEDIFKLNAILQGVVFQITAILVSSVNGIDSTYTQTYNTYNTNFTSEI